MLTTAATAEKGERKGDQDSKVDITQRTQSKVKAEKKIEGSIKMPLNRWVSTNIKGQLEILLPKLSG